MLPVSRMSGLSSHASRDHMCPDLLPKTTPSTSHTTHTSQTTGHTLSFNPLRVQWHICPLTEKWSYRNVSNKALYSSDMRSYPLMQTQKWIAEKAFPAFTIEHRNIGILGPHEVHWTPDIREISKKPAKIRNSLSRSLCWLWSKLWLNQLRI